ncbi:MAG: hypothetical protein JST54_08330 [Deltaproteobacteria bacterium]|nr:hypothetical protein [Deltaproteobacteria bacterium]
MRASSLIAALVTLLLAAPAQAAKSFSKDIETAKRIAETVQASIAAANTLMKKPHDPPKANTFFALLHKDTWFVYFGWLEPDGSKFTPALVMAAPRHHFEQMKQVELKDAPADVLPFARAVTSSRATAMKATGNPHVDPVLVPEKDGISVYVMQGGTREGALLLGGDFLDRYDRAGTRLLSRLQYHKAVIAVPQSDPKHPEGKPAGSYHTHVIDEGPTPTDIAAVLLHPTLAPMLITGRNGGGYRVDEQGNVHEEKDLNMASLQTLPAQPEQPAIVAAPGAPDVPAADPKAAPANAPAPAPSK